MATHWYTAYGLTFASDLPLPELEEVAPANEDVRIVLDDEIGAIVDPIAIGRIWSAADDQWLQCVDGVGRFYVSGGSRIAIEQWGSDRDVRAFLFGSTLGALLHQRGFLTLHASSFVVRGRAVLVAGASRAGKSTALTEMIARGHPMIADDKTVVVRRGSTLETVPGFASVRLWPDSARRAGLDEGRLGTVRDGGKKFVWSAPDVHGDPTEVGALCVLGTGDVERPIVERLRGPLAFEGVLAATYRHDAMVRSMGGQQEHFDGAAQVATQIPVYRLTRPRTSGTAAAVADAIIAEVDR